MHPRQKIKSNMKRLLTILMVLMVIPLMEVSAQNLPERGQVRKGNRLYNKGNYLESIERYKKALEYAPQTFEATYDMGNALYKAERYDHAEKTMQKAAADSLRTDTERAEAFYNLGNAQFKQQKLQEALESYKQSLRLNPADMECKYNYAYTKRLLEDQQNQQNQQDKQQQNQQDKQQGDQNQQNQDQQNKDQEGQQNPQDQQGQGEDQPQDQDQQEDQGDKGDEQEGEGEAQPVEVGISEQEQEQMLDAIQAQEDRTQEKLKEKRKGVLIRGKKNW